jgi:cytochrome c oxidase assembly protein subunit 11
LDVTEQAEKQAANRRVVIRAALVAVAMFGFGFAMVPLYDLFCDITGLNGKTGVTDSERAQAQQVDRTRVITVEFTGNTAGGLPWEFRPTVTSMEVHPGEVAEAVYVARNTTDGRMVGRAIPSVAPNRAAAHFKKTECFCFSNQELAPGEAREMPVRFVVESNVPDDVHTITLSYSFFNAEKYTSSGTDKDKDGDGERKG